MRTILIGLSLMFPMFVAADDAVTPESLVAAARADIVEVDVDAAQALLDAGALLVDVREPEEYAAGHIPGAVNVPRGVLEFRIARNYAFETKAQPIVVYCRTGGRAALATQSLNALGYTGAVSLAGGIAAWRAAEAPVSEDQP